MKILIVEDESKTALTLKQGLEENDFEVKVCFDGSTALLLTERESYDLIVCDIIMPGLNGYEFCKKLRTSGKDTPVIMLTALGMVSDKVKGFDIGADDYIVKPFAFDELLARIRALLKRSSSMGRVSHKLGFHDLEMDLDAKEVKRAGKTINLTAREFALMEYLIRNQGKTVSRREISEKVWDINFDTGTNVIEVYVNYLRKKVDKDFPVKLIHTRVGMGYILKLEET